MAYGNSSYGGGSGSTTAITPPTTIDTAGAGARSTRGAAGAPVKAPSNDDYVARLTMAGTSGSSPYVVSNSTVETGEATQGVAGGTGTVWWTWTPGYLGRGTVDAGAGMVADVFLDDGTGLANLTPLAGAPGTGQSVTFDVRLGETYAVRAYATNPADMAGHTMSWSVALAALDLTLATTTIPWAPGSVTGYIANDTAASTVSLSFDGGAVVQTVVTDSEGGATFPVGIPALTVGSHTLHASSTSGRTADITFTVQNADSFTPPTPPPPPTIVSGAAGRWRFQDPVTAETWDFPINPSSEDSPVRPRTLTSHWTTAMEDGQPIVFEGGRRARSWTIKGDVFTLADLNAVRGWRRPYRVYVTDDLGRTFVVKVRRVATQPVRDVQYPEHHTYTLTAMLFGVAT